MNRVWSLLSPRYRFRSSVTGLFVTKAYALLHPRETVAERVEEPRPPRTIGGG